MFLSDLKNGEKAIISKVLGRGTFRKRITEMGFVRGKVVEVIKRAPLEDPIEYAIMGYNVSLRKSEAAMIEVVSEDEAALLGLHQLQPTTVEVTSVDPQKILGKTINIALVGNPNTGKTSLFNHLAGAHEHVGNYSGVTVELKTAQVKLNGYTINITDLPGTYSLTAYSPEEVYVRTYISEEMPDLVINVVDCTNLERNLYLTTELIDMDARVIMALNMYDEFEEKGDRLDYVALGQLLGIPMVPTVAKKGTGLEQLLRAAIDAYNGKCATLRHIHIGYGAEVEASIVRIQEVVRHADNVGLTNKYSTRFISIKLLEGDHSVEELLSVCPNQEQILGIARDERRRISGVLNADSETAISDAKYGFIAGALKETLKPGSASRRNMSKEIDQVLTNKYLGFPIFLLLIWAMFYGTFTLGGYPVEWIEHGMAWLSDWLGGALPDSIIKSLLVNGVVNGVGSVIAFLPNILLLFLFISFFEDTGYMARAVFITDKLMHHIGLHGKSFIPLIMGFGCNVPAIMATRTIENRNQRILTMLMIPFMSCSARLPVYVLLIGAFFPANSGTVLFLLYLGGILVSIATAFVFNRTVFKDKGQPFVMELPPYRIPTLRSSVKHMWFKGSQYVKKMAGIILLASVAIWALNTLPLNQEATEAYKQEQQRMDTHYQTMLSHTAVDSTRILAAWKTSTDSLSQDRQAQKEEHSYLGRIGKTIEPVMRPLGFDWKMSVSLLTGIIAKEAVVSTMGVIYQAQDDTEEHQGLTQKLQEETYSSGSLAGSKVFTTPAIIAFLVFILLYFPCVAVVGAIYKESKSRWIALLSVVYTTGVAWLFAFAIYQVGMLFY